jgi:CheY-like chemotaxis protein
MSRIRYINWKPEEASELVETLQEAGYDVDLKPFSNQILQSDRANPPDAILIDLGRIPSQGRDLAISYRTYKDTRHCPILFLGGDQKKVDEIRRILPDAFYTSVSKVVDAITDAIENPLKDPIVPASRMQGYVGTPLPKKLGIKENSIVALIGAPEGFAKLLGDSPAGVQIRTSARGRSDITLWFITHQKELHKKILQMGERASNGGLWIIWPKKASGRSSDLTQNIVRQTGLDSGLVDFKIASVDETWSGLRFTIRKKTRTNEG